MNARTYTPFDSCLKAALVLADDWIPRWLDLLQAATHGPAIFAEADHAAYHPEQGDLWQAGDDTPHDAIDHDHHMVEPLHRTLHAGLLRTMLTPLEVMTTSPF